jgi:hypothetical protein
MRNNEIITQYLTGSTVHQKFPDGIVCTDDNYSCQYDITQ